MRTRCLNPRSDHYAAYGGRGITVAERWNSFENFLADMGERPEGTTLDRIDGNKGYELGNCRWATAKQQCNNLRTNVLLEFDGRSLSVSEWAREKSIPIATLHCRIAAGWSAERALSEPIHAERRGRWESR